MYNEKEMRWQCTIDNAETCIYIGGQVTCTDDKLHDFIRKNFNKGLYKIILSNLKGSFLFKNKIIIL